jgi:uncharacterized protein (DUF2384 family)
MMAQQRPKHADLPSRSRKRRKALQSKPSKKGKRSKDLAKTAKALDRLIEKRGDEVGKALARQVEADLTPVTEPPAVVELDRARLARISKLAETVFGDREKADRWLGKPKRALGGKAPLSYLTDDTGEQTIEQMLYQIDYGVFS